MFLGWLIYRYALHALMLLEDGVLPSQQYQISPHINIGALCCVHSDLLLLVPSPLNIVYRNRVRYRADPAKLCKKVRRVCVCVFESSNTYWLSSGFLPCMLYGIGYL